MIKKVVINLEFLVDSYYEWKDEKGDLQQYVKTRLDKIKEEVYSNARRKQVSMSCFISEFSLSDLFTDEVLNEDA